jgi:nucleotide-binding universal stress UspA family protein
MATVRKILCPIDFSKPSLGALQYGAELARAFGAELWLLHVVPMSAYPTQSFVSITGFPNLREEIRKRVDTEMNAARAAVGSGLRVQTAVREGIPHDEILAAAAETGCDWIVMATHGHTGLKHALVGSTAERVVRLSPIPVLTLRQPAS